MQRMRARLATPLVIALAVVTLASCGDDDASESAVPTFTEADSGQEVLVEPGDRFDLRLESNATTGYNWVLDEASTGEVVEVADEAYVEPDTDALGAPGEQVFTFEAVRPGATTLRLEYVRPFEDQPVPAQVLELAVTVDESGD